MAIFLLTLFIIVVLTAPRVLPWIIEIKLKAEIAARLNARLQIGRVTYLWPYGVQIDHCRLISTDPAMGNSPLFDIGRIVLTLAKLPIGEGPLLISEINIANPQVHLVRNAAGFAGMDPLVKPSAAPTGPPSSKKLSDIFELHRLQMSGGQIEYEDRAQSHQPVIWRNLDVDLQTTPTAPSQYDFQFTAKEGPVASINATGDMDIDRLLLNVAKLNISVQTENGKPAEQLPPQLQALCREFAIAGKVTMSATATLPLQDVNHGAFSAEVHLANGTCRLPDWDAPVSPIDVALKLTKSAVADNASPADVQIALSNLRVVAGNQFLSATGDGTFNPSDGTWAIERIIGAADLGDGPGPISKAGVNTHLPFDVTGAGELASGGYIVHLGINDGSALYLPKKLPMIQIGSNATFTPGGIKLTDFHGMFCGGDLALLGDVESASAGKESAYNGIFSISNIDLRQLANVLITDQEARQRASGTGEIHLQFHGNIPREKSPADSFAAKGDFDIRHGHFANIPVLKDVLANVKESNAATIGEAAATFTISHRQIYFQQAAASAPAVGVLGHGTLGFNGAVNMSFIVTPLADWREKLASTDVPILNTIGAAIVGKAQSAVNVAESEALYQYRVTGPITNPRTQQVPAPALTDAMRPLFHKMSGQKGEDEMGQELRRQQQQGESN